MTQISDVIRAVDVGLTVLTHRVLTLLALLMTFGLFCWSMQMGDTIHFAIAGAFGAIIFLPTLVADRRPEARWTKETPNS